MYLPAIRRSYYWNILFLIDLVINGIYCKISGTGPVFILEPPHKLTFFNNKGASISCLVHGDPDPIVTWVTDTGSKQENVPGFLEILRNNSLVFVSFETGNYQQEIHSTSFRCKATNRYGTIVSNRVNVKALVDQQYSTQVYDEYIIEGNTAVFKCHIPSYVKDFVEVSAWIRNDQLRINNNFDKGSRYYITGNGNLHVIKINAQTDSDSVYKCETRHTINHKTTVSDHGARLHITELSSSIPPKIVDISASIDVTAGETAILPCVSQSYPPPSYSWCFRKEMDNTCQKIDLSQRKDWTIINEGSVLIVANKNDSGTYMCSASNEMGQEDAVTEVTVYSPLSVFIHPQTQMVDIGDSVNIECVVSGGPIRSIQWFKDGMIINEYINENFSKILNISPINVKSVGMYQCFVENEMEAKQASAQITLSAIPTKFTKTFQSVLLKPGKPISLHCSASGDPLPKILWKLRDSVVEQSRKVRINSVEINNEISSTLSISEVESTDGGLYTCEAVNKVSKVIHRELIQVYGPVKVWPVSNITVITGKRVVLQCHVSGYPIQRITWYRNERKVKSNRRAEIKQNGSLVIDMVDKQSNQGRYKCKAENSHGLSSTGAGFLKVIEKPVVVLIPSIVLKVGGRLQISCTVSEGDQPIKFTWLLNDLPLPHILDLTIADAGFSSMLIGVNVNRNHFGNYTCHAKNEAGSDSKNTEVFVKDSPVWNEKPNTVYTLSQLTNIQIPCSGSGYPKPRSFWFKVKDEEISELEETSRIKITDSGSLIINKITEMDFGTKLLCSISNGISPDLQQEIQISKLNSIKFKNFQNNYSFKQFERVTMKCQVQANIPVRITWQYGSKLLGLTTNPRVEIKNDVNSTDSISTLIIKKVRVNDSGFYICKVQKDKISNSTRFYLSVEGGDEKFKQGTFANRSKEAKEHVEHEQTKNFTSSSVTDNFQLYGVAMLYIIPTVTAAIVLLVILIIVCVLLHGQQQKRNKSRTQEMEMRKSWKDQEKDLNGYEYRTRDKRSSLSKSSETYYEIKPNKRFSEDQYQFYSQMSSSTCNPDSSSITPYATFRSCTDPVPPIPGSTYPSSTISSMRKQ